MSSNNSDKGSDESDKGSDKDDNKYIIYARGNVYTSFCHSYVQQKEEEECYTIGIERFNGEEFMKEENEMSRYKFIYIKQKKENEFVGKIIESYEINRNLVLSKEDIISGMKEIIRNVEIEHNNETIQELLAFNYYYGLANKDELVDYRDLYSRQWIIKIIKMIDQEFWNENAYMFFDILIDFFERGQI